jgi:hypothetical protein
MCPCRTCSRQKEKNRYIQNVGFTLQQMIPLFNTSADDTTCNRQCAQAENKYIKIQFGKTEKKQNLAYLASISKTNITSAFHIDVTYSSVISILIPSERQTNKLKMTAEQQHFLCWHH